MDSGYSFPFGSVGLVTHRSGWGDLTGLAAALLAGIYYVLLGGLLSYYLKGGSNVLALIVVQAAAFMGILFSAGHRERVPGPAGSPDISPALLLSSNS